ncbi:hypothetical protein OXPF_11440 [Oxobacter pfennigii]|uniref:SLH domain-containing protein n=1 Tax=Oxobacter pfennigii TaxID=36849 RepID=A0A0P8X3A4_9CLOT|nr:sialate O-acetylesterase [Oxobacter pfennigii]KPU45252.1 hypothetical protein OXPF_11440 [Oxobacter pfennigii]
MKKYLTYFSLIGAFFMIFSFRAKASESSLSAGDAQWYYYESFSDKKLNNNIVKDKNGKEIWRINNVKEQKNTITDTGALELGDARYMQRAVLTDELWGNKQDYAMEFNINIQKAGNEGHSGRPIAVIIPRSRDKEYYAVTYYMENTIANQFKFKWAIINTSAPTKMKPLVEGYHLLKENIDYTGRLVIENTNENNVNIKFYIDGPTSPMKEYKPLLEYTDNTSYKILSGATGPALGMAGYSDDGWGTSPVVRYDNIKLYDIDRFEEYERQMKEYVLINPKDIKSNKAYGQIKYLINKGILNVYSDNDFRPYENVSASQFLKMLIALKGEKYPKEEPYSTDYCIKRGIELEIIKENEFSEYNNPITKYDAALMIARFNGKRAVTTKYGSFIKDYMDIPDKYKNAVIHSYYEGYFILDDDFRFSGNNKISRAEASTVLLKMLDAGLRKVNYDLELPHILSSGAVLQGNKKAPIWGRGVSGETITVRFRNQVKTALVKNGHWYLELDPVSYGGPYTLTVENDKKKIVLSDIMVGEVFIVAGQSNAEMFLGECNGAGDTVKKFKNKPNLRFYSGEQITAVTPNFTSIGKWEHSSEWALKESPAIGTFFAEKLLEYNEELAKVTIGIIRMTYGGTSIEAFMPDLIAQENNYVPKDNEPIMSGFWNGFMEPITPFAIKGVIYYQGENSAHLGYKYEPLLRDYLRGLRAEFQDPNLPIMLVQLAGYGHNDYEYDINEWPKIRAVQMKVANTVNNTGLVTAVDLSDADPIEIHPKEKKEIGRRLANLAMGLIYGKQIEQRSAELKYYRFEGNKVTAGFNYDYGRIYFKKNAPLDFQVLDKQGKWHMANAAIDEKSNTLSIWSDEILEPIGVRYAWVNYPSISLYNNVNLPVLPFRIIDIPKTTENIVKATNHMLINNDAIVNSGRDNIFRVIVVIDENTVIHEYAIKDQTAGDMIERLSRLGSSITQEGTTETIIKSNHHGLSVGDWIRNNTRGWEPRKVNKVLDEDTIEVDTVKGQSSGDDIERYKFIGNTIVE